MGDQTDLETRIRILEDIEAIKRLQHRYWNSISVKKWDDVADCFAQDGLALFGPGREFKGIEAIRAFYKEVMAPRTVLNVAQGHNAEIEMLDENTARGTWQVDVSNLSVDGNAARTGVMYDDLYARVDGEWKIKRKETIFLYSQPLKIEDISTLNT